MGICSKFYGDLEHISPFLNPCQDKKAFRREIYKGNNQHQSCQLETFFLPFSIFKLCFDLKEKKLKVYFRFYPLNIKKKMSRYQIHRGS